MKKNKNKRTLKAPILIGIDPGIQQGAKSGGIAVLHPKCNKVWPMPSVKIKHGRVTDSKALKEIAESAFYMAYSDFDSNGYVNAYIEEPILGTRIFSPQLWENYGAARQAFTDMWFKVIPITPDNWQWTIFGWKFRDRSKAIGKKLFQKQKPQLLHDAAVEIFKDEIKLKTKRGTIHTGICAAILIAQAGYILKGDYEA